jgi:hypothetical protein
MIWASVAKGGFTSTEWMEKLVDPRANLDVTSGNFFKTNTTLFILQLLKIALTVLLIQIY